MAQHGGLAVIHHDPSGHALEKMERIFVTTQELLLALPQSELDVEQAAVTENPDKERERTEKYRANATKVAKTICCPLPDRGRISDKTG